MAYMQFTNAGIRLLVLLCFLASLTRGASAQTVPPGAPLRINDSGYYEGPGVNVMLFDDFYPDGHQGGLTVIQCGRRMAANGDVRLEPTPGQWSPVPRVGKRQLDRGQGVISVELWYPDSSKDRKGFNPILYPDLRFRYTITTASDGGSIRVTVDLDEPLPASWADRVGFNLELFPGDLFGEHYLMDGRPGLFPRQANGPMVRDRKGDLQSTPLAAGRTMTVAPGNPEKEMTIATRTADLQLIDGRGLHNNGWFVLRSTIPGGAVKGAVVWIINPGINSEWRRQPVIQVSQVGYHPGQAKVAVIELDQSSRGVEPVSLVRIDTAGERIVLADGNPALWGRFLRYAYVRFDFSAVTAEGLYKIRSGSWESNAFEIRRDIFASHVWQPTVDYFLPIQMCHMRIEDRYKVWHGLCHMDDALMAPLNHDHFDGYSQLGSTLTRFAPGEHVPGVNIGGWHDAGDYDLRIESQAETVYKLSLAYELFRNEYDQTSINQATRRTRLHTPDGKPDLLQQVEHGLLSILGGFESLGRLYRGIICPTLEQYVHLGDAGTMSDNLVHREDQRDPVLHEALPRDDRWVFTEENPRRSLAVAQALAAAGRVLQSYDPVLAGRCMAIAEDLYTRNASEDPKQSIGAAAELFLSTSKPAYRRILLENAEGMGNAIEYYSEVAGRVSQKLHDPAFTAQMERGARQAYESIQDRQKKNPYGVPYEPYLWGAGWDVQSFGVKQLFLHLGFPRIVPPDYALKALDFVLGCHPGENTSSFVSGVGVRSLTVAYGTNRDEWSYIPGGVGSGTALIRPDLPELRVWPYFWQQAEYVMGGGTADFLILAMAADRLLNKR